MKIPQEIREKAMAAAAAAGSTIVWSTVAIFDEICPNIIVSILILAFAISSFISKYLRDLGKSSYYNVDQEV